MKGIWKHVKVYEKEIYKTVIASVAVAGLGVFAPFALGRLIDKGISLSGEFLFASIIALYLMYSAKDYLERYVAENKEKIGLNCEVDLRRKMHDHLNRLPFQFHQKNDIGGVEEKIDRAANYMCYLVSDALFLVLPETILSIAVFLILLRVNYLFSVIIFLTIAIYTILTISISRSKADSEKEIRQGFNEFASCAHNTAINLSSVKSLKIEGYVSREYHKQGDGIKRSVEQLFKKIASKDFLQRNILTMGTVATYGLVLLFLKQGKISFGDVIIVVSYTTMLTGPFSNLSRQYGMANRAMVSIREVNKILNEPEEQYEDGEDVKTRSGAIKIENLCFSPNGGGETLNNVSMEIPPGPGMFAIVGESGSGKTTLWKILLRYLSQNSGKVFLGGMLISKIKISSLRKHILSVERTVLFDKSIRFNVGIGDLNATEDEIKAALRAVRLDYLIGDMDRIVGPSSDKTSNGEIQRILIARALLNKTASIYVFDEPTQALDPKNSAIIMKVLINLSLAKKVIVITHDLKRIVRVKKIFVMEKGRIVEQGTHKELMAQNGRYAEHFIQQNKNTNF